MQRLWTLVPGHLSSQFCTVQLRTLFAAHFLATLCLSTTSGPDLGKLPGFMVFRHAPIPRKGSGKQQQLTGKFTFLFFKTFFRTTLGEGFPIADRILPKKKRIYLQFGCFQILNEFMDKYTSDMNFKASKNARLGIGTSRRQSIKILFASFLIFLLAPHENFKIWSRANLAVAEQYLGAVGSFYA